MWSRYFGLSWHQYVVNSRNLHLCTTKTLCAVRCFYHLTNTIQGETWLRGTIPASWPISLTDTVAVVCKDSHGLFVVICYQWQLNRWPQIHVCTHTHYSKCIRATVLSKDWLCVRAKLEICSQYRNVWSFRSWYLTFWMHLNRAVS